MKGWESPANQGDLLILGDRIDDGVATRAELLGLLHLAQASLRIYNAARIVFESDGSRYIVMSNASSQNYLKELQRLHVILGRTG